MAIGLVSLAVEGPAESRGFTEVLSEPPINKGGLASAADGNNLDEVCRRVGPGAVEKCEPVFAADQRGVHNRELVGEDATTVGSLFQDRKSTRLNSSHLG